MSQEQSLMKWYKININRRTQWDHVEIIVFFLKKKGLKATLIILNVVLHLKYVYF